VLDELKSLPPEWGVLPEEVRRELAKVVVAIGAIVPLLADKYSKFWGELEKLGLAFRCENFLKLLPEARNIILDLIVGDVIRFSEKKELLSKLASLNLLYHYFPVRTPEMIKRLYEDLQTLGLGLGDLENVAKRLQQLGVVSPFNRDKPPHLIVYDEKKYREVIIEEIKSYYHSK
jgi:hypothetical protein